MGRHRKPGFENYVFYYDKEDSDLIAQREWTVNPMGYVIATIAIDGERFLHRLLMKPPPGYEVDHIDRDPTNNRRSNLRISTRKLNADNRGMFKNNTSGYMGVSFHKGKWQASYRHYGILHYLGRYNTPEEAHRVYLSAKERLNS